MQLCEKMADELGDIIRLSTPVVRVDQNDKGSTVTTLDNKTIEVKLL